MEIYEGDLYLQIDDPELARDVDALPVRGVIHKLPNYNVATAKVLKNKNLPAPHPMYHESIFKWKGPFEPFSRQVETAGFLAWHDRAFCLNDMGCVDGETEYLTPTGWKKIKNYTEGEEIAVWDMEDRLAAFEEPKAYIDLPNGRPMIHFRNANNEMDQMVTQDHRMVVTHGRFSAKRTRETTAMELIKDIETVVERKQVAGRFGETHLSAYSSFAFKDADPHHFENVTGLPLEFGLLCLLNQGEEDGKLLISEKNMFVFYQAVQEIHIALKRQIISTSNPPPEPISVEKVKLYEINADIPSWDEMMSAVMQTERRRTRQVIQEIGNSLPYKAHKTTEKIRFTRLYLGENGTKNVHLLWELHAGTCNILARRKQTKINIVSLQQFNDIPKKVKRLQNKLTRYAKEGYALVPQDRKYCFSTSTTYWIARRGVHVFVTGNTGKTASAIWATEYLREREHLGKTIVITAKSTMEVVWRDEIYNLYPDRTVGVIEGSRKRRLAMLEEPYNYMILGHDGFKQPLIMEKLLAMEDLDLIIVDEASGFRNPSTQRYRKLRELVLQHPNVKLWALTGTPAPNAPTDVWAMSKLINPYGTPTSMRAFKEQVMWQVSKFIWQPLPSAVERIKEVMQPAIRFKAEDCTDMPILLPPVRRQSEMTDEQIELFNKLKDQMVVMHEESGGVISAANAAVLINKLYQVCCGNIYDAERNTILLANTPRLETLYDACVELGITTDRKTIIFIPFKHTQYTVAEFLTRKELTSAVINGDVKAGPERNALFNRFQDDPSLKTLVAHPRVAAHGLNLDAATSVIWFAPFTSYEYYKQANHRIARASQTERHLPVLHIGAHPIEWRQYKKLSDKGENQNTILEIYESIIHDLY